MKDFNINIETPKQFSKLCGWSFYVSLHRSIGLSVKKMSKSVKNFQKRCFMTNNNCTSEHQDCDTILECTIVHTNIKQSPLSWKAAIKRHMISMNFID